MNKFISFIPTEFLDTTNGKWIKAEPTELILPKFESKITDIVKISEELYLVIPHNYFESYICKALVVEEMTKSYTFLQQYGTEDK